MLKKGQRVFGNNGKGKGEGMGKMGGKNNKRGKGKGYGGEENDDSVGPKFYKLPVPTLPPKKGQ